VGAEAGVTITVTEKKPSQSSAPKKNIRTKKTPLAKVVASETSDTSAGSSATKRKIAAEKPAAVQTALAFDQPKEQASAPEQSPADSLPKPLPVDQDDISLATQAVLPLTSAEQSAQMSISIIEPNDNPLPKPQPV
jgi:hypothetical protein